MKQLLISLIDRIIKKILFFLGILKDRWCLAVIDQHFKIKKILYPPKGFFWADPFFFKNNNKEYVFYESYSYKKKRGEIACGQFKDNKIINSKIFLKKNYHLSYPFLFRYNGDIFLIPETHQKKRLEIYKCIKFPFKWKLFSTGFTNKSLVDTTILQHNKSLWLFTNEMSSEVDDFNKKLHIYKIDSPKLKKIIAHTKNPVINNLNGGRNAGSFMNINKEIIRPSQINKIGKYGYALKLSKVKKLTTSNYVEKKIKTILPNKKFASGIHHITRINEKNYIVDICLKYSFNK